MEKTTQDEVLRAAFKYQDALTAYAFWLLQDWMLAQDAVQEAYIVLAKKWEQYDPSKNIFTWVRQIVRFEALNILRSRRKEASVCDEELMSLVENTFENNFDEQAALKMKSEQSALHKCMSVVSKNNLSLLLGFYRDRRSCEALSGVFKKSANAVRLTLTRVRNKIRECVSKKMKEMRLGA